MFNDTPPCPISVEYSSDALDGIRRPTSVHSGHYVQVPRKSTPNHYPATVRDIGESGSVATRQECSHLLISTRY